MKENVLMGSPLISTNESGTESLIGLYFRDASQNNLLTSDEEARLSRKLSRCYQALIEELDFPSDTPLTFRKTVGQIPNTAPLSKRAKRAICLAWACREKLINANLRLSVHIARRYTQTGVPMSDLIQDANVGLIKAVDRFDPSKGYKFSTYAFWWINEEVNLHSQKGNRVVKIPENALNEVKAFNKQSIILYQKLGRAPNQTEIAESIGSTIERVGDLRSFLSSEVSTSTPVTEESSTSFGDTLEADEGLRWTPSVGQPEGAVKL
jgi:RNA polymerase nonessential primary-like sigma factor